jgi:hypothetical protein
MPFIEKILLASKKEDIFSFFIYLFSDSRLIGNRCRSRDISELFLLSTILDGHRKTVNNDKNLLAIPSNGPPVVRTIQFYAPRKITFSTSNK